MIADRQFLLRLKGLGLNSYEAKLWVSLLSRGSSTAGELSDISNVPRSRTYDVLESLKEKGFIQVKKGKPIRYIAVKPETVIDNLKTKVETKTKQQLDMINLINEQNMLEELNLLHLQGKDLIEPYEMSGSLKGRQNIYNHIESMIRSASKSIDLHTTSQGLIRKMPLLLASCEKAKKKGIQATVLADIKDLSKKELIELKKVCNIKHTSEQARYCIIDNKESLLLLGDEDTHPSYDVALWLNSPSFSSTLKQIYDKEFMA